MQLADGNLRQVVTSDAMVLRKVSEARDLQLSVTDWRRIGSVPGIKR